MGEEAGDGQAEHRHQALQLRRILDRLGRVELHHPVAGLGGDLQAGAKVEVEAARDDHERDDRRRGEVHEEVEEAQIGRARDEDVRRVADQRRGAADVGGDDLDQHERDRVDVQRVGQQERDRHHQQDGGQVVQEGREHRGRDRQRSHDRPRTPLGELTGLDRDVGVDAGRLGQLDHEHHAHEQADRVEVDRLDRLLLLDRLRDQHEDRAAQGDLRAVDLLGGDQREGADEDDDRKRHQAAPGGAGRGGMGRDSCRSGRGRSGADQSSRRSTESLLLAARV